MARQVYAPGRRARKEDEMAIFSDGTPEPGKSVLLAEDDPYLLAIAERYGGVAAMNEKLFRGERAFRRLYRELDALYEQYPDQWVAMDEDGIVAVADSHEGLLEALAAKGLYAGDLVIEHLNTQPEIWIL